MSRGLWSGGLALLATLLLAAGTVSANEPGLRTSGQKSTGSRTDITVPYLTNNGSTFFGPGGYVAPRVYSSPIVDDQKNPGATPVYNLPFWGAVQGFGDVSVGATPRSGRPYAR